MSEVVREKSARAPILWTHQMVGYRGMGYRGVGLLITVRGLAPGDQQHELHQCLQRRRERRLLLMPSVNHNKGHFWIVIGIFG